MRFAAAALIATTYAVKLTEDVPTATTTETTTETTAKTPEELQKLAEHVVFHLDLDGNGAIDENEWEAYIVWAAEQGELYDIVWTEADEEMAWMFFDKNSTCNEDTGVCEVYLKDAANAYVAFRSQEVQSPVVAKLQQVLPRLGEFKNWYYDGIVEQIMGHADQNGDLVIDNKEWNDLIDFAVNNREDFAEQDARDYFWYVANEDFVIPVEEMHEALVEEAELGDNWVVNTLVWAIEDGYDGEDNGDEATADDGSLTGTETAEGACEENEDLGELLPTGTFGWCEYEMGTCDREGVCFHHPKVDLDGGLTGNETAGCKESKDLGELLPTGTFGWCNYELGNCSPEGECFVTPTVE